MGERVCIPQEEYGKRLLRAQELLGKTDLDVLLVNSNEADFANVRYFSDYWPIFEIAGVVIPREGKPTLICGPESEEFAKDRSVIPRVRKMKEYRESADPAYPGVSVSTFKDVFAEVGVTNPRKIGIDIIRTCRQQESKDEYTYNNHEWDPPLPEHFPLR